MSDPAVIDESSEEPLAVGAWHAQLATIATYSVPDARAGSDAELDRAARSAVELMGDLESLVAAAAAAQARAAVMLDRARREQERRAGVPPRRRGRGVGAEIGLARRVSVSRGTRLLGLAHALGELRHTRVALAEGRLSERRAALVAREAACLDEVDRARLDAELCASASTLAGKGDREVRGAAQRIAYRMDPVSVTRRSARAESERRVWLRPAPDTMTYLSALLPVTQGVAAYAALCREADNGRAAGEERGRGQVMADTLVERVTGQTHAEDVPLQVNLVMSDATLLADDPEPAHVRGHGPVPAAWARDQVSRAAQPLGAPPTSDPPKSDTPPIDSATGGEPLVESLGDETRLWIRRLYASPTTGALVALESRSRQAPDGLADFIRLRDSHTCRVLWCDAPARHVDHVVGWHRGGATEATNLQSLCEAHNYAKEARGWTALPLALAPPTPASSALPPVAPSEPHRVRWRTPSGRTMTATASPVTGRAPRPGRPGAVSRRRGSDREHVQDARSPDPPHPPRAA